MRDLIARNLIGSSDLYIPYETAYLAMREFTRSRAQDVSDEVWFLEHSPVYTLGQAAERKHILQAGDIPVVETDRGGQVTYHGPGMIMIYCLMDIGRSKLSVRDVVENLENLIIHVLAEFGVKAYGDRAAPGVYVDGSKIASIGLRFSRGRCYHGVCLYYKGALQPFSGINPCGFEGLVITQMSDVCRELPSKDSLAQRLGQTMAALFNYDSLLPTSELPELFPSDFEHR